MPALPNVRREQFAQEVAQGCSHAEAYRKAGYTDSRQDAYHLLRRPDVSQRVAELREKALVREQKAIEIAERKLDLKQEHILRGLASIAFADLRRLARWNADGLMVMDSGVISDADALAISEVSLDKQGRVKLKLHDKIQALQLLGRHLAMFKEHVSVEGLTRDAYTDAENVRNILIGRFDLIAERRAANENAERPDARGDGTDPVGLEDLGPPKSDCA